MSMDRYFDPFVPRQHLEHGYGQDPADFEMRMTPFHMPHRLIGKGFEAMFPGGAPTRSSLWAGRTYFPDRRWGLIAAHVVGAMRGLARLEVVDPRWLMMSQSAVTAAGVRYYMQEPDYPRTGITCADRYQPANAFPADLPAGRGGGAGDPGGAPPLGRGAGARQAGAGAGRPRRRRDGAAPRAVQRARRGQDRQRPATNTNRKTGAGGVVVSSAGHALRRRAGRDVGEDGVGPIAAMIG